MRTALVCAVLMALSLNSMAQGSPAAQVEVRFDHPEQFRDASLDSHGYERAPTLCDEIPYPVPAKARSALPATGPAAGHRYPRHRPGRALRAWHSQAYDVRFMREITWPSIDLTYTLSQPGKPAQQAEERVSDKMYLSRPGRVASSSDRCMPRRPCSTTGSASASRRTRQPEKLHWYRRWCR